MPTLCNHFHASVAGALPGLWHRANSWHDRRCRSGEWNKLPSFSLSATSSGNTDEHYMTEIATNVWLWKIMTHRRANTVTGRGKQTNCVWVISTLQVCRVNNKIKRSNFTVHNMYWDLFTKHLEVVTGHIQTTKGGVGPAKTTTKSWGQHTSTKSLSSCGSPVQERKKKCPEGKKITSITDEDPKKEKNYVWCFGWLRLRLAKIDEILQSSARRHYVQGLQLQSTWFWCGIVNF